MADTPTRGRSSDDNTANNDKREPPPRTTSPTGQGVREQEHRRDARNVSYWYPDRKGDITEVTAGFSTLMPVSPAALILLPIAAVALILFRNNIVVYALWSSVVTEISREHDESVVSLVMFLVCAVILVYLVSLFFASRKRRIYLVDYETYQPPDGMRLTRKHFIDMSEGTGWFSPESVDFQRRLIAASGLGDATHLPLGITGSSPPEVTMQRARDEVLMVFTGCCDEVFRKTGVRPQDVDIVIVNCSLFNPTPSIAAMIINTYKMRRDVKSYNLSGMGCSAGMISIDLARDLLQLHKNKIALVFSTENITQNWYKGDQKSMLLSNCLFRVGGAAILLTNKSKYRSRAKYELITTVRVQTGAYDEAYQAIYQMEDEHGFKGVRISRDLGKQVGHALKSNITVLAPQVLPYSEQIKWVIDYFRRKMDARYRLNTPVYTPNFKKAFQHFCIHAGGRAIIDGLEENLKLSKEDVLPSRATLYRYGNTSSSSVWYELNYIEQKGDMKRGDKTWQIAFGSGLKCNTAVWRALRTIRAAAPPPPPSMLAVPAEPEQPSPTEKKEA